MLDRDLAELYQVETKRLKEDPDELLTEKEKPVKRTKIGYKQSSK